MAPKKKQEKMALGDFLTNQSLGSWADEMETQPLPSAPSGYSGGAGGERRAFSTQSNWGDRSGGFEDRPSFSREALPLPDKPPYTAHLGNLAFDVSQSDVEGFLNACEVTSVRIVEDKLDRKPKGFGYVEFATLDGLKKALTLTDTNFMGRPIRISVAEPPKDRPEMSRNITDWTRKGPLPDLPSQGRQPSRGYSRAGGFDAMSDAGSERGGSRRPGFFENDGKVRDFGNWDRKGPLTPAPGAGPPAREGGRLGSEGGASSAERKLSPSWGEGRSDAGSRPPREFQERAPPVERAPTAADMDNQWRSRMRPDAPSPVPTPDASTPTSPAQQAPKERVRLNLAKRTVSTAEGDGSAASSGADAKASPFGAARPTNTAAREREIEEKRELAVRQKREADDKAKEEKAARDAAAKAARPERGDDNKASSPSGDAPRRTSRPQNGPRGNSSKENGEAPAQREKPRFSILKHETEGGEEEAAGEADAVDASANGNIVDDKETKPQEVVREAPSGEGAAQPADATAETMEDEGWSTVAAKPKNARRGGARALAS